MSIDKAKIEMAANFIVETNYFNDSTRTHNRCPTCSLGLKQSPSQRSFQLDFGRVDQNLSPRAQEMTKEQTCRSITTELRSARQYLELPVPVDHILLVAPSRTRRELLDSDSRTKNFENCAPAMMMCVRIAVSTRFQRKNTKIFIAHQFIRFGS